MMKERKATGIKTLPEDDRPREKLLKKGAGALSNSELLAILLRTGTQGISAIDLARKILKKFSTFRNMAHTDARDWKEFKGLGGAKIAHIIREIIHAALQKFAKLIVCVHNHPSANITPSTQDKKFTKELSNAGKLMDIKLIDHIIIGDSNYYSFADEGEIS